MKRLFLAFFAIAMSAGICYSQTDQGAFYLGGSLMVSSSAVKYKSNSTTVDGPKTFSFGIDPKVGFFMADNLMIGAGVGFNMSTMKQEGVDPGDPDETKLTVSEFHIMPLARYYIKPWENTAFFIQGGIPVAFGKEKDEVTNGGTTVSEEAKITAFGVHINPGLVYWATDAVCLEVTVGELSYMSETAKTGSGDSEVKTINSGFDLNFNPAYFSFGVGFHF